MTAGIDPSDCTILRATWVYEDLSSKTVQKTRKYLKVVFIPFHLQTPLMRVKY